MFARTVNPSPARATASYNPFPFDPKINPRQRHEVEGQPSKVLPGRPDCGFGKYPGIFTDRIEVSNDKQIIKRLMAGRRRAAGLAEEDEEKETEDNRDEPKPN